MVVDREVDFRFLRWLTTYCSSLRDGAQGVGSLLRLMTMNTSHERVAHMYKVVTIKRPAPFYNKKGMYNQSAAETQVRRACPAATADDVEFVAADAIRQLKDRESMRFILLPHARRAVPATWRRDRENAALWRSYLAEEAGFCRELATGKTEADVRRARRERGLALMTRALENAGRTSRN